MGSFGIIASMETNADPWDIMAVVAMVTVIAARMTAREPVVWEVSKKKTINNKVHNAGYYFAITFIKFRIWIKFS